MGRIPLLFLLLCVADAARVLIMPSTLYPVHPYTMSHLVEELAKRKHEVTWVEYGPKESSVELPKSVKKIHWPVEFGDEDLTNLFVHRNHSTNFRVWQSDFENPNEQTTAWLASVRLCDRVLQSHKDQFDQLVKQKFDTVIVDDLYNPCGLLQAGLKGAVFIYWSMTGLRTESAWANQSPSPPSYLPVPGTKLTDELTFWERSYNLASYMKALYVHQHIVHSRIDAVFQKHYPGVASAFDLERNASINFVNTPPIFDFARPYMPRVNFVGGLHCKNATEIRGQLSTFLDEADATNGFIVFTGGFSTQWGKTSSYIKESFISAFQANPNIRFVWQYNGEPIENLPLNVYVTPWLPQQNLLGHPKCKAHISMGGLNSVIESVWHGVPTIGYPLTAQAYDNLLRITARGAGIMIPKEKLGLLSLKKAIKNIYKKTYRTEMAVFQDMVRDVPYSELTHAAFWVEFIDRHQEVPHARSGADKLNVFQYFLVDVILFMLSALTVILAAIYYSIRMFFRLLSAIFGIVTGRKKEVSKGKKDN